ncbi:ABC transporter ATP-binding protein [Actinophytocola sediminis]
MKIQITGLTKTYRGGTRALDGLDLTVPTGMFGLLGANGAGKTTLMRILAGLLRPSSGRVLVADHDLGTAAGRAAVKRVLGYLPQDLGVYPDLTAREFLDYVALLKGIDDRAVRRRRVAELLEVVALSDVAKRRLKGFSGGMKRRVGIAQALLNDPRLLIVDEPTAGLDPEERIRFRTLLAQLAGDRTVLLSTHIVEDIAQTCRELAMLDAGRVVFRGTVAKLTALAEGRVWSLVTPGPEPEGGVIVSVLPDPHGVRYRVVASEQPTPDAVPVTPSLEEGYITLRDSRTVLSA